MMNKQTGKTHRVEGERGRGIVVGGLLIFLLRSFSLNWLQGTISEGVTFVDVVVGSFHQTQGQSMGWWQTKLTAAIILLLLGDILGFKLP